MRAKIISAFPACGKSTYYKKWSQYSDQNIWRKKNNGKPVFNSKGEPCGVKILDSDSSLFSWIYDENGNKTDKRNPDFPNNYIQHIKEHMDTEDIIFISSHKVVRQALEREGIPYYLIYPHKQMKEEWMTRFKNRGNDESFIKFQDEHWDEFIDDMENETFPTKIVLGQLTSGRPTPITPRYVYDAIDVTLISDIIIDGTIPGFLL